MILEIAVFNYESALIAANAGADRLELCDDYAAGGVTVSPDVLRKVRAKIAIPVFPIIRPRGGDFCYTKEEFHAMEISILCCKKLGFEGVVLGILNEDKSIDIKRTLELVAIASPLEVTFHRAFDECSHPLESLEQVISCGCKRILSSGQKPSAIKGKELLEELVGLAGNRIIIMPGGGVRSDVLKDLIESTAATEFHSAALVSTQEILTDTEEIKKMLSVMRLAAASL